MQGLGRSPDRQGDRCPVHGRMRSPGPARIPAHPDLTGHRPRGHLPLRDGPPRRMPIEGLLEGQPISPRSEHLKHHPLLRQSGPLFQRPRPQTLYAQAMGLQTVLKP